MAGLPGQRDARGPSAVELRWRGETWAAFGAGEGWERQWAEALGFCREYARRDPRLTVSLGPHSPYICPESFLRAAAEAAAVLGLKLHIHVSEEPGQLERSLAEKGRTPVQVLDAAGILRPGPVRGHDGQDGPGRSPPGPDRGGAAALPPGRAASGPGRLYGRIEEGSLGDLVLLDPRTPAMLPEHDVFANILCSLGERNVHTVLVDGKVLVRAGRLMHLDLEELARKTGEIAARLTRSAAGSPIQEY